MVTVPKVNRIQVRPDATPYQDSTNILRAMQTSGELDIRMMQHIGDTAANIKENQLQAERDAAAAERQRIAAERHLTAEQRYAAAEARRLAADARREAEAEDKARKENDKKVAGDAINTWRTYRAEADAATAHLTGGERVDAYSKLLEEQSAVEAERTGHMSPDQLRLYTEGTYATQYTFYQGIRKELGAAIKDVQIGTAEAGIATATQIISTQKAPMDAATLKEASTSIRKDLITIADKEGIVDYEAIDLQVSKKMSDAIGVSIQHRINSGDWVNAEAILNQTSTEDMRQLTWMDPALHGKLTKSLQELKDEEIPAQVMNPGSGEIDYTLPPDAFNKQVREVIAEQGFNAEQEKNAYRIATDHKKRWKEVDDQNHDSVLVAVSKNGRGEGPQYDSFEDMLANTKTVAEFVALSSRPDFYEKAKAAWEAGAKGDGHPAKSESKLMTSLFKMNREELAALDPEEFNHRLSTGDYDIFVEEWRRVTRFVEDQENQNVSFTQAEERVKNYLVMHPQEGSKKEAEKQKGNLIYNMTMWLNEMHANTGEYPSVTAQEEYLRLITEPGGAGFKDAEGFRAWVYSFYDDPEKVPVSLVEEWEANRPITRIVNDWDTFSVPEQLNAVAMLRDNELIGAEEGFRVEDAARVATTMRLFPRDVDRMNKVLADIRVRKERSAVPYWWQSMTSTEKKSHLRQMTEIGEQWKAMVGSAAPVTPAAPELSEDELKEKIRVESPANLVKPADESDPAIKATFMTRTRFFEGTGEGSGGDKYTVFQDPEAGKAGKPDDIPLIGYGFNLNRPDAKKVIEELGYDYEKVRAGEQSIDSKAVNHLMELVYEENTEFARKSWKNFDSLSANRKLALLDLIYTMGTNKLSADKAKKTKKAIEAEDWEGLMKLYPENGSYHSQVKDRRWVPFKKAIMEG